MHNTKTIRLERYSIEITQMPLNKQGRELGWKEQYKQVRTWGNFAGQMSNVVETSYYWKNDSEKKIFNTTNDWAMSTEMFLRSRKYTRI